MSKRRFEFVNGNSNKFWEIETDESHVTVRFGRIGTAGQAQSKTLEGAKQARLHAQRQITAKLKKGYAEVALTGC